MKAGDTAEAEDETWVEKQMEQSVLKISAESKILDSLRRNNSRTPALTYSTHSKSTGNQTYSPTLAPPIGQISKDQLFFPSGESKGHPRKDLQILISRFLNSKASSLLYCPTVKFH